MNTVRTPPTPSPLRTPQTRESAGPEAQTTPNDPPQPRLTSAAERPTPNAPSAPRGAPGLAFHTAQQATGGVPASFDLLPGRFPEATDLSTWMKQNVNAGERGAVVQRLAKMVEDTSGMTASKALTNAAIANPDRLVHLLIATPERLSDGIDALNAAYQAGALPELPPMPANLPDHFDLANVADAPVSRPATALKEVGPNLWHGGVANAALSDAQARTNIAVAETLDRLASNADRPAQDQWRVQYAGETHTQLDTFLAALEDTGHHIEARVEHRVANFADLKTQRSDGSYSDVPMALLVELQHEGATLGHLPTVHSELVISIRPGPNTPEPKIQADTKWYQGISGTGFFPCDLYETPAWCGRAVTDTFEGPEARRAIELAGLTSDVINASAEAQSLAVGGYGTTGVCNDSVAVIQHAMTGETSCYPLLMRDATLFTELEARIQGASASNTPKYEQIKASITALPSDTKANPSALRRALEGSVVWPAGAEPFEHVVKARAALQAKLQ